MSSTIGTLVSTARLLKHGYLKGKIAVAAVSAVFAMTGSVLGAQIASGTGFGDPEHDDRDPSHCSLLCASQ